MIELPPPPPGVLLLLTVITLLSVPLCVIVNVAPVHEGVQSPVFVTCRVAGVTPSVPDTCRTVNHPADALTANDRAVVPSLLPTVTESWLSPTVKFMVVLSTVNVCADAAPDNSSAAARSKVVFLV